MKGKRVISKTGKPYCNYYLKSDGLISGDTIPPKVRAVNLTTSKSGKQYFNYYKKREVDGRVKPGSPHSKLNLRLCLTRDGFSCKLCGSTKNLDTHHLDREGPHLTPTPNNNLSNLITLCHSCHVKLHHGIIGRDNKIILMRNEGQTFETIGNYFGVSRQRVHQICSDT